jgi:probable rRNA maturation factor
VPRTSVVSTGKNPGLRSTTLKGLLRAALERLGFPRASVSLVLTDDARIRILNRDFLETDRPTDVLSFPLAEPGNLEDPARDLFLGEIYISVETARAQARTARRPLSREVAHLAIHGLLHLLGHDHAKSGERRRMRAIESRLLRTLAPML